MSNIEKVKEEDLVSVIKRVMLKYCPYTENRIDLLADAFAPTIGISIQVYEGTTHIYFDYKNRKEKEKSFESILIPRVIQFEELRGIMDFILQDHEVLNGFRTQKDQTVVDMGFNINWCERNLKGMYCSGIQLQLDFYPDKELANTFLYWLFQNYYDSLEKSPTVVAVKNEVIQHTKTDWFENLDKEGILRFLSQLSEEELRDLAESLDNEVFWKYTTSQTSGEKPKQYFLKSEENG